jgi:hypothetical protein
MAFFTPTKIQMCCIFFLPFFFYYIDSVKIATRIVGHRLQDQLADGDSLRRVRCEKHG